MASFELNDKQLDRMSEFLGNFSILVLATLVIPNLFGIDKTNLSELRLGLVVSAGAFVVSLYLLKSHE